MVLKYPVRAISNYDGNVVLFTSERCGTVESVGEGGYWGVGHYAENWVPVTAFWHWEILGEPKMKTKAELMQEIERLKSEVEKLADDEGMKVGDKYWYLDCTLAVDFNTWTNHSVDIARLAVNNVFLSEAEAEKESRHRLFEAAVTMRFKELGGGVFKVGENNHVIATDLENNESFVNMNMAWHVTPRGWHTQDRAVAEQIMNEFDFVAWARGEL